MKHNRARVEARASLHGRAAEGLAGGRHGAVPLPRGQERHAPARAVSGELPAYGIGLSLLGLFMLQYLYGLRWDWLAGLQLQELYKQLTGYLMFACLLFQWRLGLVRQRNPAGAGRALLRGHRYVGALAPLAFYFHSMSLGHAYQLILGGAFLMSCLVGLLHRHAMRSGHPIVMKAWLTVHILLAVLVSMLVPYHIYIVYLY